MTLCNGSNECRKIPKFTRSLWGLGIFGSFDFFYQCFIVLLCQKMATMNIQLNKQNVGEPWGFRLQGGQDFRQQLMIKKVSDLQTREWGVGGRHLLYTWIWDVLRKFNWVYFRIFCLIFLFKSKCFMLYKSLWKFLSSACSHCFTDCKKPQQQYLTFLKKFLRTREQLYVRSAFSISDCAWA